MIQTPLGPRAYVNSPKHVERKEPRRRRTAARRHKADAIRATWPSRDVIRVTTGKIHMPSTINLHQIGVWFCVGFFTGAGWALAAWLVGRIFSHI
jgi:hypothetical protein